MKTYTVNIGGLDHTLQLSDEDAERIGAKAVESKVSTAQKAKDVPNKARPGARNKDA